MSERQGMPVLSARIDASCRPIKMNTRPLNSSSRTLQTPRPRKRVSADSSSGLRQPR